MVMLTRIGPAGLTANRLDPTYYRPEHLRDAQLRAAWTRANLDELRSPSAPIVYGVLKPDDRGEKFRVAKAERFEGMFVSAEDCDPVSEEMFHEFGRAEAIDGDLLVAIGGYVGRPALLRVEDGLRVVVNRHLARVRIDKSHADSGWVLAYFSSARGERQLTREITGSVQAGINLCDLRLVDVPLPAVDAQRYVGDKVRQAERLRARARVLESFARGVASGLFDRLIDEQSALMLLQSGPHSEALRLFAATASSRPSLSSIDAHRETKHTNRVAPAELSSVWAAPSYRPEITDAIAHLKSASWKPLGSLCREPIVQGRTPTYANDGSGHPCLKTRHVSGLFVDDREPDLVTPDCARELERFRVDPGTILMNRSGAGSVGRCAVYLSDGAPLTNEHLLHIKLNAAHDPCFLVLFLSSWWGERAIEQGITGSTGQLNLANDHVSRIPVPVVDQAVQASVGDQVRKAGACARHARALTTCAKLLVKRLIEGSISEADLVAAQKALEAGDRSADREILKGLRQSDAPDAKPLIADVDALYALLDGSEGQDA